MEIIRRWFLHRPLRRLGRRRPAGEAPLDHSVRRAALAAAGTPGTPVAEETPPPAARLVGLLPYVRSLSVRWEDLQGRPVCRSTYPDT